jgi:membrane dipeptidase
MAQPRSAVDADYERIHRSLLLIDTHNDVTSFTIDGFDIGAAASGDHTTVSRLRAGGVGAQFFAAYVAASYVKRGQAAHRALQMIDTIRRDIVDRYPEDFELALSAADIERIHREGKIAALIGIEGGHAIEDDVRLLRDFYALGVRYMTLTHTNTNNWADSSGDITKPSVRRHNGLTPFGRAVIREMNRLGMMVDISHVSDKTFWDALATSSAPLIASHSSCRALTPAPRNMTDEMIRALAKKGGVVQINFACGFLSTATFEAEEALARRMGGYNDDALKKAFAAGAIPRATLGTSSHTSITRCRSRGSMRWGLAATLMEFRAGR